LLIGWEIVVGGRMLGEKCRGVKKETAGNVIFFRGVSPLWNENFGGVRLDGFEILQQCLALNV
jgi:hypothetical protein